MVGKVQQRGEAGSSGRTRPALALGPWRVAATYIGTVVGAGFASGQEILRFFTAYDGWGTLGLLGVTALLAAFGVAVMRLGAATGAESHRELVRAVGGRWLGTLADWVITGFLFAGTAVMIAGSSAIFREQLGLPGWPGGLVMAAAATVTVLFRLRGVTAVTSLVAPVLVAGALGVSAGVLWREGWPATPPGGTGVAGAAPFWPLAALLYTSFNLVLALPVLAPLGAEVRRPATLNAGGLLGGAGLGLAALALHLAVWAGLPATARFEVPMLVLARRFGPLLGMIYAAILWLEVYTTAVTSLYGVAARLRSPQKAGYGTVVVVLGAVAFAASFVGFANLVTRVYPLVGYLGLLVMAAVAWRAVPLLLAGRRPVEGKVTPRPAPVPVPAFGRALARAAAAAAVLWGGAGVAGGPLGRLSVPELGLWLAAGAGLALTGALVDKLGWAAILAAGARTTLAAGVIAFLLEFGLGSLWLATTGYAAGTWLPGSRPAAEAPAAPDPGRLPSAPGGAAGSPPQEAGLPPGASFPGHWPGAWWLQTAPSAPSRLPSGYGRTSGEANSGNAPGSAGPAGGAAGVPGPPAWAGDLLARAGLTWPAALAAVMAGTAAPAVLAGLSRRRRGGGPPAAS